MDFKKINFKQQKYILPLVGLPFILFLGYQIMGFVEDDSEKQMVIQQELSTDLGDTQDSILAKNEAYDMFYGNKDNRSMIDELQKEKDSLNYYSDNLDDKQKRYLSSTYKCNFLGADNKQ